MTIPPPNCHIGVGKGRDADALWKDLRNLVGGLVFPLQHVHLSTCTSIPVGICQKPLSSLPEMAACHCSKCHLSGIKGGVSWHVLNLSILKLGYPESTT